jgi:IPT/TIG domain
VKHVRMLGLCLVAVFLVSAMAAASALASEAPTVTKLEPNNGPTTPSVGVGIRIYINGTGFHEGAKVKFGTTEGQNVSVASETELSVEVPPHEAAEVEVIVEDENGTSSGGPLFTYRPPEKANIKWNKMKNCPFHGEFEEKPVEHCDYAQTRAKTGGFYTVGGITVPIIKPIKLQAGATEEAFTVEGTTDFEGLVSPENGEPTVVPVAEPVPVAILNNVSETEMNEFNWPENLRSSYRGAQAKGYFGANKTTEIIEPAGKDQNYLSPFNILVEEGVALLAHVQITGQNPWLKKLGGYCRIGSEAEPVVQHLSAAVSESPLTHATMHGKPGFAELTHNFELAALLEDELVDNTYSVPAATKCGGQLWEKYLNPVINKAFGLPAPAGASETRLEGTQYTSTTRSAEEGVIAELK